MKVGDHSKWEGVKFPLLTKEQREVFKHDHRDMVDHAEHNLKIYRETRDKFYLNLYTIEMLQAEMLFEVGQFEPDPRYVEMNKEEKTWH